MNHSTVPQEVQKQQVKTTADIVKKKVATKNTDLFRDIFRYDFLIKDITTKFSINTISLFVLLILILHICFGYSFTIRRIVLFVSFVLTFIIIYILYKFLFQNILDSKKEKYQYFKHIYPFFIIILFISLVILIYLKILLPMIPKKLHYRFPI
jgi:hypothetical protein